MGLIALGIMFLALSAKAHGWEPPAEPGNHFIVLIDDSGDMKPHHRADLERDLPQVLFEGLKQATPPVPPYQPATDHLSLGYFTIYRGAEHDPRCKANKKFSAEHPAMFHWEVWGKKLTRQSCEEQLTASLRLPCRFRGYLSPIATAQLLALPAVSTKLPREALYSRTFILVATNEAYNVVSPSQELTAYQKNFQVADVDRAADMANRVAGLFSFHSPPSWNIQQHNIYFHISEVKPRFSELNTLFRYRKEALLDRRAISPRELLVTTDPPDADQVWVPTATDFEPRVLSWGFSDTAGREWFVGKTGLPLRKVLNLENCPPEYLHDQYSLAIPMLEAAAGRLTLTASDKELTSGKITFRIGFRFRTDGLYDHCYLESDSHQMALQPVPPLVVTSETFFPALTLTNRELAHLWTKAYPKGLTQEEAAKLVRERWRWWVYTGVTSLVLAVALGVLFLFLTAYHRPFCPQLTWEPAPDVVVDFNQPPAAQSRLLLGSFTVTNPKPVPWLGQLLNNEEQPTRQAALSLKSEPLTSAGFMLTDEENTPLGFITTRRDPEDAGLARETREPISDGRTIPLFLAMETLRDFVPPETTGIREQHVDLRVIVHLQWPGTGRVLQHLHGWIQRLTVRFRPQKGLTAPKAHTLELIAQVTVTLKPEDPARPLVTYEPDTLSRFEFSRGAMIPIGRFSFKSQASRTLFSLPFRGDYSVLGYQGNFPVGEESFLLGALGRPSYSLCLSPGQTLPVSLALWCDHRVVTNPDPSSETYQFRLSGPFNPDSNPGPFEIELHRDPSKAEIELRVDYGGTVREFYWTHSESVTMQKTLSGPDKGREEEVPGGQAVFPPLRVELEAQDIAEIKPTLCNLYIGNSAKSGTGLVSVDIAAELVPGPDLPSGVGLEDLLTLHPGWQLADLLEVAGPDGQLAHHVEVGEEQKEQARYLTVNTRGIAEIPGARLEAGTCRAVISFDIVVNYDKKIGGGHRRSMSLVVPLELEQLPGQNWLCIDFGTSAIAAAYGSGALGEQPLLNLQDLPVTANHRNFSQVDPDNSEMGTPFLPSWVVCDADQRSPEGDFGGGPGFPTYYNAADPLGMQVPENPAFVGLPALSPHFTIFPGRIIYALKSWLGQPWDKIILRDKIPYRSNGREFRDRVLPRNLVVASAFSALVEAYLKKDPQLQRVEQIVLTYPNTFTDMNVTAFTEIAWRVFSHCYRLPLKDRIRTISESDAVAYYYCRQEMVGGIKEGPERLLVYDFGAGTLDLSVIPVTWVREGRLCYPVLHEAEGRLGVPLAGNYLDGILARQVDELLRRPEVCSPDRFTYHFPVVGKRLRKDQKSQHRQAILRLWEQIKEAKHRPWDGKAPFTVLVGKLDDPLWGCVSYVSGDPLPAPPETTQRVVWMDERHAINLTIPAADIHTYPDMADFIDFMTGQVIDELMDLAGLRQDQIDTLIISGRGAQWPGIQNRLKTRFAGAHLPDFLGEHGMKLAVVQGAIARQWLRREIPRGQARNPFQPRLGILVLDTIMIMEDEWPDYAEGIPLEGAHSFSIYQVNVRSPHPATDLKSWRQYFYYNLTGPLNAKRYAPTGRLKIRKEEREGWWVLILNDRHTITLRPGVTSVPTSPPWPVGQDQLEPRNQ